MYQKIMVPVDLENTEQLSGALSVAQQIAEANGSEVLIAGVHGGAPSSLAHNADEYQKKLDTYAASLPCASVCKTSALPIYSRDPGVEIGPAIVKAAQDNEVQLIVMASHMPGWVEHVFHSNAGYVACHATMSVFVVR
ncbi:MAG: universal stress protein [Pseudomonadota bacterium]